MRNDVQDAHRDSLNAIEKGRIDTVVLASAWSSLADANTSIRFSRAAARSIRQQDRA